MPTLLLNSYFTFCAKVRKALGLNKKKYHIMFFGEDLS